MVDLFNYNDFAPHKKENNKESQGNLDNNYAKFTDNCKAVYDYLMGCGTLTTMKAIIGFYVNGDKKTSGHLPRRIKDLRENGVKISEVRIDAGGTKEWYMSINDRNYNRANFY